MADEPTASTEELHAVLEEHGDTPTQRLVTALLVKKGVSKRTIAAALDRSLKTIYNWLDRFEDEPVEEAPFDQPRPGAPTALEDDQKQQLFDTLQDLPKDADYDAPAWTPALVHDHVRTAYDIEYSRRHIRRLMHEAGLSYRTARPQHHESDPEAQAEFKQTFKKSDGSWTSSE